MDVNGANPEIPLAARAAWRAEIWLIPLIATALVFLAVGQRWLAILPDVVLSSFTFAWLLGMIVIGLLRVVMDRDVFTAIEKRTVGRWGLVQR